MHPPVSLPQPSAPAPPEVNPLPVPAMRLLAPTTEKYLYSVTTICCHGQLSDRAPTKLLQWQPSRRIHLAVNANAVVAVDDPNGDSHIGREGHLRLPAAIRHQCGITPGDRLLIAVSLERRAMFVYPFSVVDDNLASLHQQTSRIAS